MKPLIAIVGRPNVGKSTLFNRLIGKRLAVISEVAGTTRDRIYQDIDINGFDAHVVDTGGLEYGKKESIEGDMKAQAEIAIQEADLIYFIIDSSENLTVDDYAAADLLRKSKKEVVLIANKFDSQEAHDRIMEFFELGFGEPIPVSAIHKTGVDELIESTEKLLKKLKFKKTPKRKRKEKEEIRISFLGKPNVGKSSLVNALLGENRVIVSEIPGTTRDSTNTHIEYNETKFSLIDTAGLRRRGKIERGIEKFSSLRCFQALDDSDVALLIIDFSEEISKQDMHIAEFILDAKKGAIIIVNKIDLADDDAHKQRYIKHVQKKFSFMPWAPLILTSATEKKNIEKIFELAEDIYKERQRRIPTSELNSFIKKITFKHLPSGIKNIRPKILYVTQSGINPPEFILFVNQANAFHFSYKRYLENQIRKEYGFDGTAIDIQMRSRPPKEMKK
jgi:GTP-binding protein